MNKIFRILFVCTGNTCRSPMAEGILKKMLRENGIDYIQISSAGTDSWRGCPASLPALEVGKSSGIDLTSHSSRKLTQEMLREADLILAMSKRHLDYIKKLNQDAIEKSFLLKSFPQGSDGESFWIDDPVGGTSDGYRRCFSDLKRNIERIFPRLVDLAREKLESSRK